MDEAKTTATEERIDLPERTDSSPWTATILELLQDWGNRAAASASTHYLIAGRLAKYNVMLGVPVVMFTTFVGTSVFATLQDERSVPFAITVGMVSVAAAVLASLQTFLRFSERAEKHRVAATRWGAIRREIALMIALHPTYPESRGDPKKYLDNLRERMDKLSGRVSRDGRAHLDPQAEAVRRGRSPGRGAADGGPQRAGGSRVGPCSIFHHDAVA